MSRSYINNGVQPVKMAGGSDSLDKKVGGLYNPILDEK